MAYYSLKYYNEQLQIDLADWKTVFLFKKGSQPIQMQPKFHQGNWCIEYQEVIIVPPAEN